MPVSLSKRLAVIADICRGAEHVIDVGCDHGKLAARLLQDNPNMTASATDISADSLEKARVLIESLGFSNRCKCVCCDGLEGVEINSGDYIVLSGMGPDVIDAIIEKAADRLPEDIHLVLSPASHHEKLRSTMAEKGFFPTEEHAVFDQGHLYAPGLYLKSGEAHSLSPGESAAGIITADYTEGIKYLTAVRDRYSRIFLSAKSPEKKNFAGEVCTYINSLLDAKQE